MNKTNQNNEVNTRTIDVSKFKFRAEINKSKIDQEKRIVPLVWTTGKRVLRYDWFGNKYYEEIGTDPKEVDLERLNGGAAFLKDHKSWSIDYQVGVVLRAWFENGEGHAEVQISKHHEDSERIWGDINDGILKNLSVGYFPQEYVEVPVGDEEIPVYRAEKYEPFEISLVAVPADPGAQIRSAVELEQILKEQDIKNQRQVSIKRVLNEKKPNERATNMKPEGNQENPTATPAVDVEGEKRKAADLATQEVTDRSGKILKAVRSAKLDVEFAEKLIQRKLTFEQASEEIFKEIEQRQDDSNTNPAVRVDSVQEVESKEERGAAIAEAIMHRANPSGNLSDRARSFRHMSLLRIAEETLLANGARAAEIRGLSKSKIAMRALSSSDFAILTGNVLRKSLAKGYTVAPPTFWPLVNRGTLSDYKEATRVNFGSATSLKTVPEGDEYEYGQFQENGEKIKLAKNGRLFKVTEELIVNDDLQALIRVPTLFGQAASRVESKLVYTDTLVANPDMADGVDLFHADHGGNLLTAAAINETSMGLAEKALMSMKSPGTAEDSDFLNLTPAYLVVGTAKKVEAQKLLGSLVATKSGDVNPFNAAMSGIQLIVDPRITGNKWFVFANPAAIDTIEVAYLEGEEGVQISEHAEYKNDCLVWKVKHVVAVKAIDYRGMAYNPGA